MGDDHSNHDDGPRSGGRRAPIAIAAVAGVLALAALGMASCGDRGGGVRFWQKADAGSNACPRPASLTGSEFNAQETGLRALRRAAFRGDFFAQLELGSRYSAVRATDKNIEDPIESATWYAMALSNDEGYAPINRVDRGGFGDWRPLSKYDDCRAYERHTAYQRLDRQLGQMTREEQESVRDRVVYVLSTQDAEGFRTLARLHDGLYGPFGEPEDNREA
ncbi:MAG: sel1 repeat family protein, partial [Alphaproteobacteria bacterium]|nr:sel1 repeat family protein [Alphaproteobacteria bacterium]